METKEFYISPEVELICFRPAEPLANLLTSTWAWGGGSGDLGEDDFENGGESLGNGDVDEGDPD